MTLLGSSKPGGATFLVASILALKDQSSCFPFALVSLLVVGLDHMFCPVFSFDVKLLILKCYKTLIFFTYIGVFS